MRISIGLTRLRAEDVSTQRSHCKDTQRGKERDHLTGGRQVALYRRPLSLSVCLLLLFG